MVSPTNKVTPCFPGLVNSHDIILARSISRNASCINVAIFVEFLPRSKKSAFPPSHMGMAQCCVLAVRRRGGAWRQDSESDEEQAVNGVCNVDD